MSGIDGFLAEGSQFFRCPACNAVLVDGTDQGIMEVVEVIYYVRSDLQKLVVERHDCA